MNDYAGATPEAVLDSVDQFWSGQNWATPDSSAVYHGIITRGRCNPIRVTADMVTDGMSNTMVVGEKWVAATKYLAGDWHDDCGWGDGWDPDVMRSTAQAPQPDSNLSPPNNGYQFGSVHPNGIQAVFGDGSVKIIRYTVDRTLFNRLGHRSDGGTVDLNGL